jgi:hypothetical protein
VNKFLFSFLFLLSHLLFAQNFEVNKDYIQKLENRVSWVLKQNGEYHNIQNVSGKQLRLDLWIDKFIAGTPNKASDGLYVICGSTVQQVAAGTGIVCDIPYPGSAMFIAYPFANGATGQFSIGY